METTRLYSVSQDLPTGKLSDSLALQRHVGGLSGVSTSGDVLTLIFVTEPTDDEILALDGGSGEPYGTHPAGGLLAMFDNVAAHKVVREEDLRVACQDYILAHYNRDQQASLGVLFTEAAIMGYATRIQYVGQALAWIKTVIGYYYGVKDAMEAATTEDGVDAVTWDFSAMDATDPGVVLRTAAGIVS
jgi:hypothetical protein